LEKNVQSIVGSFVLVNNKDHQSFRTAEIIKQVSPGYYFVQFDNMGGDDMPIPIELVGEGEMASVCENCGEYYLDELVASKLYRQGEEAVQRRAEVEILRYAA